MRRMFSEKQIEKLAKSVIAGASNSEKIEFAPSLTRVDIELTDDSGFLLSDLGEYTLNCFTGTNIQPNWNKGDQVELVILFDSANGIITLIQPSYSTSEGDYVLFDSEDSGYILTIIRFTKVCVIFVEDNN